MIEIKKITAEQTYGIRLEVLRKGINKPYQFDGDFDINTFHAGAFENDKLVGISTIMKNKKQEFSNENQYQLRGMAILPSYRGKGIGNKMINYALKELSIKKSSLLWCNAREVAVDFYIKMNFKILGEKFYIEEVGNHFVMYRSL